MKVTLNTSYHLLFLAPFDIHPDVPAQLDGTTLGAVTPDARALVIQVGVRDGRVEVHVTTDPDAKFADGYQDEAEFTLNVDQELWLEGWSDAEAVFSPERPGLHHVRVRARGRQDNYDLSVSKKKPVEFYQLAIWPAS